MKSKSKMDKPVNDLNDKSEDCGNKKLGCKTIVVHGEKYKTSFTKKYENRKKWVKPNDKHVVSIIPGTVAEIFVKEGQVLHKGDKILLIEAMKMLNTINVHVPGKIKKINVKEGDKIPKGFVMVEYE